MSIQLLKRWINHYGISSQRHRSKGFTLVELLTAALIGSIAISGLLATVTRLLRTDRQESVRSETQREMQIALDFISQDLRESVYVYQGECLLGRADDAGTTNVNEFCPGVVNHILDPLPTNSLPVLAFWRLKPLPGECPNPAPVAPATDLCREFRIAGRTFSLVVYFLTNQSNPNWQGEARITRYELDQFRVNNNVLELTPGYVNPVQAGTNFRLWPFATNAAGTLANQQAQRPPVSSPDVLVDFVDGTAPQNVEPCANAVEITPSAAALTTYGFTGVRNFYGCVRSQTTGANQDITLYLRGDASGRRGGYVVNFLPALRTQVLGRGVVDKQPPLN